MIFFNAFFRKLIIIVSIVILFLIQIFSKSFANLNFNGLPLLQFTLVLFSILVFLFNQKLFSKLFNSHFWFILFIFILYCTGITFYSLSEGREFIRIIQDSEFIFDILFLFLSIYVASHLSFKVHKKILGFMYISMAVYFTIIISLGGMKIVQALSPTIPGMYKEWPLFGEYPSHTDILLGSIFFITNIKLFQKFNFEKIISFLLFSVAFMAQKRFLLIQLIILTLVYFKRITAKTLFSGLLFLMFFLLLIQSLESAGIKNSKGSTISLRSIGITLSSTFVENEAAAGVSYRKNIFNDFINSIDSVSKFMIGQGFGHPLTKQINSSGLTTRSPHILIATIFGRIGLIGLIFYIYFFYTFAKLGYESFYSEKNKEHKEFKLFLLACLLVYIVEAQINPTLEYTHHSYIRYYILGCLIGLNRTKLL